MTRNPWWLAVATLLLVRPLAAQSTQQDDSERTEQLRQQV
jgi:hypothetical protein